MTERLRRDFECLGLDYNAFYPGDVRLEALETLLNAPEQPAEYQVFFYHSDHLGSSSFITDINGDATQHIEYLPFGEDFIHEQNATSYYTPYTFSGKERDMEMRSIRDDLKNKYQTEQTQYSYFGARYVVYPERRRSRRDAGLSIWLSVDPLSDKYPSLSPYNYCAWNPVMFVDPNGMELDVAENASSKKDLLSIVSSANRDRVVIDGKKVSLNFEGLSSREKNKMLRQDKGMALINDMVNSDKKMLFESAEVSMMNDANCTKSGFPLSNDDNGVLNASNFGADSEGGHNLRPADGYDGQVSISSSGEFTSNGRDARTSVIFHELAENFYRTHHGYDYNGNSSNGGFGAHSRAGSREGGYFGNSRPGDARFRATTPALNPIYPIIIDYLKKN